MRLPFEGHPKVLGIVLADQIPTQWGLGFAGVLALLGVTYSLLSDRKSWIAAAVAAFDRKSMERLGLALQTKGFDAQACRIKLYFSRPVPKLDVQWED